jgi:hypothetical protein
VVVMWPCSCTVVMVSATDATAMGVVLMLMLVGGGQQEVGGRQWAAGSGQQEMVLVMFLERKKHTYRLGGIAPKPTISGAAAITTTTSSVAIMGNSIRERQGMGDG